MLTEIINVSMFAVMYDHYVMSLFLQAFIKVIG